MSGSDKDQADGQSGPRQGQDPRLDRPTSTSAGPTPDETVDIDPFPSNDEPAPASAKPVDASTADHLPQFATQPAVPEATKRAAAPEPTQQPDATIDAPAFGKTQAAANALDQTTSDATFQEESIVGSASQSASSLPRRFGDYVLLEVIAAGGMGVVFKARQRSLNRTCALKMILSGQLATADQVQRFFIEAEASAQLDHPNIVSVYEVGTQDGQHFFSMAYVEGESLAELVSERPLTGRRAAELMVAVGDAIEYAHEKGIIHRDLKPANVLLDLDETPKVTDFGLAKISTANSQVTATGQVMGTPSYMPPEQASGDLDEVGPLADVYSLGAILYCLLTGRPPFQSAQVLDTLKQVIERNPVPPRQLNNDIDRDIENICLKCLEKAPANRYSSSREFVDDLTRFLNGEPVHARPVSFVERLRRWCVRNPVIAALAASVCITLVAGTIISTYFAIAANNRAIEAERNLAQARKAVDGLYLRVSEHTLLNQPGLQPIRHELLAEALKYYEWFLEERGDDPSVREEYALNHFRVGLITEEIDSPEKALVCFDEALVVQTKLLDEQPGNSERRRAVADTLTAIGRAAFRSKDIDRSVISYRRALDERKLLADEEPESIEHSRLLANAYMNLGLAMRATDQSEATRQHLREAEALRREILDREDSIDVRRDLARGLYNLGNLVFSAEDPAEPIACFREAVEQFERVLASEPRDLNLQYSAAVCSRRLGDLHYSVELVDESLQHYQRAVDRLRLLTLRNPDVPSYQNEFANSSRVLGELLFDSDPAKAHRLTLEAAAAFETLHQTEPKEPSHRFEWALALRTAGELEIELDQLMAAREHLQRSEQLLKQLLTNDPDSDDFVAEVELTREILQSLQTDESNR